jgi:hypothetical protein
MEEDYREHRHRAQALDIGAKFLMLGVPALLFLDSAAAASVCQGHLPA